jgi:acyl carrier protein
MMPRVFSSSEVLMDKSNAMIEKKILRHLRKVIGHRRSIELDQSLESLGIDSISSLQLIMDVEREFNVSISDEKLEELKTPRDMIEHLKALWNVHVG